MNQYGLKFPRSRYRDDSPDPKDVTAFWEQIRALRTSLGSQAVRRASFATVIHDGPSPDVDKAKRIARNRAKRARKASR